MHASRIIVKHTGMDGYGVMQENNRSDISVCVIICVITYWSYFSKYCLCMALAGKAIVTNIYAYHPLS